jgi:hypothetical protein
MTNPANVEPGSADGSAERRGVEHADVIDMIGEDAASGEIVLAMEERRPWDGSEFRLFQLQEKFNAYLAFALDGELADTYPGLAGRRIRVRLDAAFSPDPGAIGFLRMIGQQIGFQGIELEVRVAGIRVPLQSGPS